MPARQEVAAHQEGHLALAIRFSSRSPRAITSGVKLAGHRCPTRWDLQALDFGGDGVLKRSTELGDRVDLVVLEELNVVDGFAPPEDLEDAMGFSARRIGTEMTL